MKVVRGVLALVLVGTLGACSSADDRASGRYCARLADQLQQLTTTIGTVDAALDRAERYREFAKSAPLEVADEWEQLAALVDSATKVDLADEAAVQEVINEAYASERAARRIADHAASVCTVTDLGSLMPTLPPVPAAPPATG